MKFDDYTQDERVKLMRTDIRAYLDLLIIDHLMSLLDAIAKSGPMEEDLRE